MATSAAAINALNIVSNLNYKPTHFHFKIKLIFWGRELHSCLETVEHIESFLFQRYKKEGDKVLEIIVSLLNSFSLSFGPEWGFFAWPSGKFLNKEIYDTETILVRSF